MHRMPSSPTRAATSRIFHICSRGQAEQARACGEYTAPSLAREGFIHCSQAHQVLGVRAAFYADQPDLVVLAVDPALVQAPLRYEAPAHPSARADAPVPAADQLFPHLYGPLPWQAVVELIDIDDFRG